MVQIQAKKRHFSARVQGMRAWVHGLESWVRGLGVGDSLRLCRPDLRKASGFPTHAAPPSNSAQAGRLSLPACAEEVVRDVRPSERRSLSASHAAEPQFVGGLAARGVASLLLQAGARAAKGLDALFLCELRSSGGAVCGSVRINLEAGWRPAPSKL